MTLNEEQEIHPPEAKHFLSGKRVKFMLLTITLSVLGYILFTLWAGWKDVGTAFRLAGWKGVGAALSLSLVNFGLRYIRWNHYLNLLGQSVPRLPNLRIYLAGFALTATPGKSGEAIRAVFLKDYGVDYRKSIAAFFAERFSDVLAGIAISGIGLWIYPAARLPLFLLAVAIVLILLVLQKENWMRKIEAKINEKFAGRFAHVVDFAIDTMLGFKSCFTIRALLYGVLIGVIAWGAQGVAFYYLLHLLGTPLPLPTSLFIYSFSMLIGGLTFMPGGLGSAEVTMTQLLFIYGVGDSDAVAATLLIRLTTLWFSMLVGLVALPKDKIKCGRGRV